MPNQRDADLIREALHARFGETLAVDAALPGLDELARIASHRVQRYFKERPVDADLLRLLCACALSAPSKSDLQQADIVIAVRATQEQVASLIADMPWIKDAPLFLVFLANGRRIKRVAEMRGKPFPNDHLDLFFNASVDAGIVLATFIRAAEAVGLGCCPISVIRDHAAVVSDRLALPDHVVPVAGLCVGWPSGPGRMSPRLSLAVTLHEGHHNDADLAAQIDAYDRRRAQTAPYARQRKPERWGAAPFYGWSEDKARQYAEPQRAGFGAFVRAKGFRLD